MAKTIGGVLSVTATLAALGLGVLASPASAVTEVPDSSSSRSKSFQSCPRQPEPGKGFPITKREDVCSRRIATARSR